MNENNRKKIYWGRRKLQESLGAADIAFCGLPRVPDLFRKSLNDLTILRKEGIVNQILFSTWRGEIQKNPEFQNLLKNNEVILIESDMPQDPGAGNIWCQMKALDVVLQRVEPKRFVLKTRSDVYIRPGFLKKIFTNKEIFKIKKDLPKGNIFSNRIWVIWYDITRPFMIADECFYGKCEDVKHLVNYEARYDADYKLGPGTAHVRRFINPFLKTYPILAESLAKSSKDASFRKFVQTFTEKVIDLRNVKFLRKMYEARHFKRMNEKMQDEKYIECLAAYYSIVYSHFYVDGRSFPEQVAFRESSTPGVKLDPNNIDNNFTKEKQRFPYGGQIYDYDEDLLNNIINKKIEKTQFSIKLMEAIDKFNEKN